MSDIISVKSQVTSNTEYSICLFDIVFPTRFTCQPREGPISHVFVCLIGNNSVILI